MTWVKTEDDAPLHHKFFRAGLMAYGWWHAALSYANRTLSDGFIAARDRELVFPGATPADVHRAIEALICERSLHVVQAGQRPTCHAPTRACPRKLQREDGYVMHDYFAYQPSRKDAMERRRMRSKVGRKGGEKSGQQRKQIAATMTNPDPTRPDPTRKEVLTTQAVLDEQLVSTSRSTSNGYRTQAIEVIEWLNQKAAKHFPAVGANLKLVEARLRGGVKDWQLKAIVSLKTEQWRGDEKMREYLRPKTLFNATNVLNYLGELPAPPAS